MTEVWLTWVGFYRQVMHLGGGCRGSCVAPDWSELGFWGRMTCSCGISCTWGGWVMDNHCITVRAVYLK